MGAISPRVQIPLPPPLSVQLPYMSTKLLQNIDVSSLQDVVPRYFKNLVKTYQKARNGKIDVLIFSNAVTLSGDVTHIISKLSFNKSVLAIGICFTHEALEVFHVNKIEVLAKSFGSWTDVEYQAILRH